MDDMLPYLSQVFKNSDFTQFSIDNKGYLKIPGYAISQVKIDDLIRTGIQQGNPFNALVSNGSHWTNVFSDNIDAQSTEGWLVLYDSLGSSFFSTNDFTYLYGKGIVLDRNFFIGWENIFSKGL